MSKIKQGFNPTNQECGFDQLKRGLNQRLTIWSDNCEHHFLMIVENSDYNLPTGCMYGGNLMETFMGISQVT